MIEDTLNHDIKSALLAGDKTLATTLRSLKSSLLYAKIATGSRDRAMTDQEVIAVLQKEAKKRQESADLYRQGGNEVKAQAELHEKTVIEKYLPSRLGEAELIQVVDDVIEALGAKDRSALGAVIGRVKQQTGGSADGASIARIVQERLNK